MTLKILLLFYRQAGLLYLLLHGYSVYLIRSHDFYNVLFVLLFLKSGQYVSVYFYYRVWNKPKLIPYMNLGVNLHDLFLGTYILDMLLMISALYLATL